MLRPGGDPGDCRERVAEKDWLYLTDPATGRVRDRLALPSAPERVTVRGDRLVVRCYDAWVTAKPVPS